MAQEDSVEEVYKLFDTEGDGLRIKDIGTVLHSLGLSPSLQLLEEFVEDAKRRDGEWEAFFLDLFIWKGRCWEILLDGVPSPRTVEHMNKKLLKHHFINMFQQYPPSPQYYLPSIISSISSISSL